MPAADHPTVHITWEGTLGTSSCVVIDVGSGREAGSMRFCPTVYPEQRLNPLAAFVECMAGPGRKVGAMCAVFFDRDGDGDIDLCDLAAILDDGRR